MLEWVENQRSVFAKSFIRVSMLPGSKGISAMHKKAHIGARLSRFLLPPPVVGWPLSLLRIHHPFGIVLDRGLKMGESVSGLRTDLCIVPIGPR